MDAKPSLLDDYAYLSGRPSIKDFVGFVRRHSDETLRPDKETLIREWQTANELIRQLETSEKGIADGLEALPLPEELRPSADAEIQNIKARGMWAGLDFRWRLIELDRLVVFQKFINLRFVDDIKATWPERPQSEDLMRVALGSACPSPAVRVTRTDEYTFLCMSESNDVRVLKIDTLQPGSVHGFEAGGTVGAVIGVFVGFSVNLLAAIQTRGRYVLFNGSHRAFALRSLGITHVPCLILSLNREEEFEMKAPDPLKENRDLYLRSPRPPLFKDYFDPRLRKLVQVPRTNHLVQFQIGYQKVAVAAL